MNKLKATALGVSVFISLATATFSARAGSIDALQEKVNATAQKAGITAPNIREEIAGKPNVEQKTTDRVQKPLATGALPKIDRMVNMSVSSVRAILGSDGKILYMLDNGRFALVGTMVDIWNRKPLRTIDDVQEAISHIDLKRMGFDLAKTNHITVGTGGEHVTVFVDTRCGWCHKLMKEIQADPAYFDKYTFDFIIVTVLGPESEALAEKLACTRETNQMTKFNALVEGRTAINALEQIPNCNKTIINNTNIQQKAMNISSVPMVISPDKRFVRGKPSDLRGFLDENEARIAKERAEAEQQAALRKIENEMQAGNIPAVP